MSSGINRGEAAGVPEPVKGSSPKNSPKSFRQKAADSEAWSRTASLAPLMAVLACVLYCVNGELLQALQLHTPSSERPASVGLNLVLCHLGGLAFAPHFLLLDFATPSSPSTGLVVSSVDGRLRGFLAARPRTAALFFAWILMGYNFAWLSSTRFLNASVTNAVFQTSVAMVYAASVPLFGEPLALLRVAGVAMMLLGTALASGALDLATIASIIAATPAASEPHAAAAKVAAGPAPAAPMAQAAGAGIVLALVAASGVAMYQVLFRHVFGHLKHDVRFLAFFSAWISVWHVLTVLPALYLGGAMGFEEVVWPHGAHAIFGTLVSAAIASTVNALYLCIALWGSVMLLPCVSALSVPLTVLLDTGLHGVLPTAAEVIGHSLVVAAVVLIMDLIPSRFTAAVTRAGTWKLPSQEI